jgi:prepilin-type N-terminal cleavage/methylation domain-containing protein
MKTLRSQSGFTLIETIISLGILAFGILTVFAMQTLGIKGNATANIITEESGWANHQIERLIGLDYEHADLDTGTSATVNSPDGKYTFSWTVEDYITPYSPPSTESTVKKITVNVGSSLPGVTNTVALIYYKKKRF